jgi:hypothetical protein
MMLALILTALVAQSSPSPSPSASPAVQTITPAPEATPAPIPSPVFSPPDTWESMPMNGRFGAAEFFGVWYSHRPDAPGENINLAGQLRPSNMTDDQIIAQSAELMRKLKVTIVSSGPHKVCNGTKDGYSIESTTEALGNDVRLVQVMALSPTGIYTATYSRPIAASADKNALAALDSLCAP